MKVVGEKDVSKKIITFKECFEKLILTDSSLNKSWIKGDFYRKNMQEWWQPTLCIWSNVTKN